MNRLFRGRRQWIIACFCLATAVLIALAAAQIYGRQCARRQLQIQKRLQAWQHLAQLLEREVAGFEGEAGIVIEDLNMGWQMSVQKERLFPSASIVKIPIMAGVFKAAHQKKLSLNDRVVLRGSDKVWGSGILKAMPNQTVLTIGRLVEIMITESDNTACNILIDRVGIEYLNAFFRSEGLNHTNLSRKMMDFSRRRQGVENYTTAADIAQILRKIYFGQFVDRSTSRKCLGILLRQKIKDRLPKKLPECVLVAHKTGLERNVCHDAGIIFSDQGHFLVCVLTKSTARTKKVKNFIANVSYYIYNNYQQIGS